MRLVLKSGPNCFEVEWEGQEPSLLQTESGEMFQLLTVLSGIAIYESLGNPNAKQATTETGNVFDKSLPNVTWSDYVPRPKITKVVVIKKDERSRPIEL